MNSKSKKTAKATIVRGWRPNLLAIVIVIGAATLVLQLVFDVALYRRVASMPQNQEPIASMIIDSIRGVTRPATIEPVSKKVYLPDISLVLPPYPQDFSTIQYSYSPPIDGVDAEANVTTANAISVGISRIRNAQSAAMQHHNPTALFDAVPSAQVCVRGLHVVFGSKTTYKHLEFTKKLADGRTMNVYSEAQRCAYDLDSLTAYLRQAQSY